MKKYLCFITLCYFVITLSGCSINKLDVKGAKSTVELFLLAYQQRDNTCSKYLLGTAERSTFNFDGVSKYFANELTYDIKDVSTGENLCIVEIEIETIDFGQLFEDSYHEAILVYGENEASKYIKEILIQKATSDDVKKTSELYEIVVHYINDEWKIEMDSDLSDALTGKMNSYIKSLKGGE